ncbi:MAG: heptaprenyl diphosphate synthase [Deltaproteobacteria bacterium HGW-Deltaproteobacteria-4]|nr:MAG: heptaprenyl diphosphate synthase [Deltaproteobacteria bacterium HGW-Deltaproteobacteria-4]
MFSTRRLVYLALLLAMATTLHVLEGLFPIPLPFPGVKLGLANIVTLLVLYLYDLRAAMTVAIARVFLGSLLGGTFFAPAFFLGLTGALISTLVMALLVKKTTFFSPLGISLSGAVSHNLGQLLMASFLLQNQAIFFYLPILLLGAIPTGLMTGYLLQGLLERLEATGILAELTKN